MAKAKYRRARRDIWILRGVALIISILLWITVLGGKRVEIEKRVTLDYLLPKNLVIANSAPKEISFRVVGPRAFLKEIEDRAMTIPIELSNVVPGDYDVAIREEMLDLPLGLRVTSVSQRAIPLKIDRVAGKRVPVRSVIPAQLPDGIKVSSVTLKPSTVEVRGAYSRIQTIDAVPTEPIFLTPNALRQEFDVKLSLADFPGVMVDEASKIVHVVVDLEGSVSRKWFRGLAIGVKLGTGRDAQPVDLAARGLRVRPGQVNFLLEGPDSVVNVLTEREIEVWAEVAALKPGSQRARLDWRLPPEVRVVRRTADYVEVVSP